MAYFLVKSGRVSADFVDARQRSLVFLAVLHQKSKVLNLLLTHVSVVYAAVLENSFVFLLFQFQNVDRLHKDFSRCTLL